MNFSRIAMLLGMTFVGAMSGWAQTSIGSVACTSSNLNGTFEIALNGRQITSAGVTTRILVANGLAVFDGLSKVTLNLTANIVNGTTSYGTPIVYSGTYTLQSNCVGSITITNGGAATFSLVGYSYNTATSLVRSIEIAGSDANYIYNGTGTVATATCPTSSLSGAYPFNATGNPLSGTTVTGAWDILGLMQFDGQGNVTATWTNATNTSITNVSATGTYSLTSTCVGSASLTDTAGNKYSLILSLQGTTPNFVFAASTGTGLFNGSARRLVATGTATCSAASLSGTYELSLTGRQTTSAGVAARIFQSNGTITFDGQSKASLSVTANTVNGAQSFGNAVALSGTYTLGANCLGTVSFTTGTGGTFAIEAYTIDAATGIAASYQVVGNDALYVYNGNGSVQPVSCVTSTLSGASIFLGTGSTLAGATINGTADVLGTLQFDGQGNITGSWNALTSTTNTNATVTGTYTLGGNCVGTAALTDNSGNKYALALSVSGASAGSVLATFANPQFGFTGSVTTIYENPALAVVNAASSLASATPPGSIFTIYGTNLTTKPAGATSVPLPTTLLTTTVTVNGENAPLFYADQYQINAQMPLDIQPGLATVIVKNGTNVSNAVAVTVPASGYPGIFIYGTNQGVVVNQNGSVNSPSAQAKVGDVMVAYFTGGGPVTGSGLKTGAATPGAQFPLSGASSVTVDGKAATVNYIGLTPGSIGLYQLNFVMPSVPAGNRALVITIAGQASNAPLVSVSN